MSELGLGSEARGADDSKPSGELDRLSRLLQETTPEKLLGVFKDQLDRGTTLRSLIAGAALANARAFAGQDYDGYHTFMALSPAFALANELPANERMLPIFKVLYRNASLITGASRCHEDHLGEETPATLKTDRSAAEQLLAVSRERKVKEADRIAIAMSKGKPAEVYDEVQPLVRDVMNVHRVVLAWRAWEILDFVGQDQARTMLRQTVRHCADYPNHGVGHEAHGMRELLPKLMEAHRLLSKKPGTRKGDDAWVEKLAKTIYADPREKVAEAVAVALGEGFAADSVAEAISLAATQLVLCDRGRGRAWPGKPLKSVHGDSVGVHASDAANAWRHIARVTSAKNTFASLIAGAYHTAGQSRGQLPRPIPLDEDVEKIREKDAGKLLVQLEEAIRGNDQVQACAITHRLKQVESCVNDVYAVLRKYTVSEDGALHAEKYYRTVTDEVRRTRPAFHWRHVIALARVTASAFGKPAPGLAEARKLFKV
jgi:hypothetical protein